ncbi:DUF1761 domain-containing protein [Guptibacillus hwajinpoensis]|uniref:F0F1-type ATP synthase assembly protein I n=1 Tax=Guptibacillus hwajinpoensis TaxID=208199 RepID=A0ABU0K609_9BACL|nr:DUF1761 domain-containing protein [Alkalihalobacillus hemicentroti]MDQ0484807.1 F0F1-type ATP synthase assembly protein I [Alkalihalobacillus hemicentroti]
MFAINYLAVLIGAVVYMMYGGIYYSILLSDKKGAQNEEIAKNQSEGSIKYLFAVIIAFISSFFVAVLVQATGSDNFLTGGAIGFVIGLLISIVYFKNQLFGLMSTRAFLIAIGDHLVVFTLLGLIHGIMS